MPHPLRGLRNIYILAEDVVLIITDLEFLIVEIGGGGSARDGTAEEVARFRISSDFRSIAVVDQAFLGLLLDTESDKSEALLVDVRSGQVAWRIPVPHGEGVHGWFRDGIVIAYDSEAVIYWANGNNSTIGTNFRFSGHNLSVCDHIVSAVTDDGRIARLPMDDVTEAASVWGHSGPGTAVIAANRDVLSAGSDGSVALTRRDGDGRPVLISRLERRLRCSGARVEELKSDRELAVFLANGANGPGAEARSQ